MNGIIYLEAFGIKVNISAAVSILMGILFMLLGNYMPKLRQNYTIGIKLPWTLCSEENWYRDTPVRGKTFYYRRHFRCLRWYCRYLAGGYHYIYYNDRRFAYLYCHIGGVFFLAV